METWPTSAWSCLKEQVVLVLTEPEMNDRLPGADAEVVETVYEMNFTYFFFFFGDCAGPPAIYRTLRFVFPGVHVFISSTRSLGFKLTSTK